MKGILRKEAERARSIANIAVEKLGKTTLAHDPNRETASRMPSYLDIAYSRRRYIAAISSLTAVATCFFTLLLPPVYRAYAVIAIEGDGQNSVRLATHQRLLSSDSVVRPVALRYCLLQKEGQFANRLLMLSSTARQASISSAPIVLNQLTVKRLSNSSLLEVAYTASEPHLAASVVNAIAEEYIRQNELLALADHSPVTLIDPARPPFNPVSCDFAKIFSLTFIFCSILCTTSFVLYDTTKQRSVRQSAWKYGVGVELLSELPHLDDMDKRLRMGAWGEVFLDRTSLNDVFDEAITTLMKAIRLCVPDGQSQSLLITSALPFEGKSSVAVSMARANADQHRRTLLIDANLTSPSVKKMVIPTGVELHGTPFSEPGRWWRSGLLSAYPGTALSILDLSRCKMIRPMATADTISSLVAEAIKEYDLVIVDGPAMINGLDACVLASSVDSTILVARTAETPLTVVQDAANALSRCSAVITGVVLNGTK